MDKIDSLIKALTEFKEELNKNTQETLEVPEKVNLNNPYNEQEEEKKKKEKEELNKAVKAPQNSPVVGMPAEKVKEVKIKNLQAQIDAGTYKPDPKKIADKMLKEELTCSENGQWDFKKSVYNAGTHPMKGREPKVGNFPSYDYDSSTSHEDNIKQAKAHFDKHSVKLNDTQFNTHMKQAKAKAETSEKSDVEKVNNEDVSSKHTDPSINAALGGKYGKIHGGNPKKPTGALKDTPIHNVGGKPMKPVSGASPKRTRNESGQSTEE